PCSAGATALFAWPFPCETTRKTVADLLHPTSNARSLRVRTQPPRRLLDDVLLLSFDELDLVPVGIGSERDDGRAMLHRPGLTRDLAAGRADLVARGADVVDADGDVSVRGAELVARDAVVVRELDGWVRLFGAITEKDERELAVGIIVLSEHLH